MKHYHNFKNFYSVVLLSLADAKYQFIWTALGAPGNAHDLTYFQFTHLFHETNKRNALPEKFKLLATWICKPFCGAVLTEKKRYFNYRLSHTRMVSEGSFDKLKIQFSQKFSIENVKAQRSL